MNATTFNSEWSSRRQQYVAGLKRSLCNFRGTRLANFTNVLHCYQSRKCFIQKMKMDKFDSWKTTLSSLGATLALFPCLAVVGCKPSQNEAQLDAEHQVAEQDIGLKTDLNGKMVEITAPCRVSLGPSHVHVMVAEKDLMVELPEAFRGKFSSGDRAWIGLRGVCHIEPQGDADNSRTVFKATQTQADGYIEPKEILFFDQAIGHVESFKVVK